MNSDLMRLSRRITDEKARVDAIKSGYLPLTGGTLTGIVYVDNKDGGHKTYMQNSAVENEHIFGGKRSDGTTDYLRIGRDKLQYKSDADTYDVLHTGNAPLEEQAYHYPNGFLIATDVSASSNTMLTLELKGNGYSTDQCIDSLIECYNYNSGNSIINYHNLANGYPITVTAFNYLGYVYFWFAQPVGYTSILATVYSTNTTDRSNRITSITNAAYPSSGVTRARTIAPVKSMTLKSDGSYGGMCSLSGNHTDYVRTTEAGIIPYSSGGDSYIGTPSWQFERMYSEKFYQDGTNIDSLYVRRNASDTIQGKIYPYSNTSHANAGMYGNYNSYKIGHIWSIGESYSISQSGANFGNLYGLAYKHTNNTLGGTMAGQHQLVLCNAGTPGVALGFAGGIWTALSGTSGGYTMRWKSTDKKFYYYSSSERFKENIRTLEDEGIDPDIIYHLTPRIFDEKLDENRGTDEGNIVGFVAEEVEKACPDIIMYNENGEVMMYSTDAVQALTVGALQKLRDRVEALESQLKIQPKALPGMGVRMKSGQGMYIKADRREGGTGVEQQDGRTV